MDSSKEHYIRKQIAEAFARSTDGFVSGQEIADLIGCSRAAVWKHMDQLRQAGYELEAVRRKGYKIVSQPDNITETEILMGLATTFIGKNIVYESITTSTQLIASKIAYNVEEGTVVVSDEQTEGRGRLGRSWHSPAGTGIWMSIILKPAIEPRQAPQLTLLTAVAVVTALQEFNIAADIKWPNDILINGKKVTGILTELQAEADKIHACIIGIGMNVNQSKDHFPTELHQIATSLAIESGSSFRRSLLIQAVLKKLETLYIVFLEQGFMPIKLLWESYAITIGKRVTIQTGNETIIGFAKGITNDGVLLIGLDDGTEKLIYSGDVTIHSSN